MLVLTTLIKWWLNKRQIAHVLSHRANTPDAFAEKISLEKHQKAADYTMTKIRFSQLELFLGSILLAIWTIGGGLNWLDQILLDFSLSPIMQGILFIILFSIIGAIIELPFGIYNTFVLEQRFGFNRTTFGLFISDLFKQLSLMLIIGVPLLYVILWLMHSAGQWWWFYAWSVWLSFSLVMMWAYPAFIAPLFNKFTELDDTELKQRIEKLMLRCGFHSTGILVMDGSKRSSHGNAYFTGLGKNKRIVFYDNLLESLDGEEIEAVLAHELGHFKKKHIQKRLIHMSLLSLFGFSVLGYLMQQDWFYHGLGISSPSIHTALILFSLILPVFTFLFSPLFSILSRKHEFEADDFAASQASAQKLIDALVKLYKENYNTLTPDPLYSSWYDSHPPAPIRVSNLQKHLTSGSEPITE